MTDDESRPRGRGGSRTSATKSLPTVPQSDDQLYTRDQVIEYMATALRWGWEACVDQQNADWPPPRVYTFGKWYDQALERERADAETRRQLAEERAA